jgi:DNA processing protein
MSARDEERLARVALARLTEPGDPVISGLVLRMGAVSLHRQLLEERELDGALTDVAARLEGIDAARDLEWAERRRTRFVVPGDDEWPGQLDDLGRAGEWQRRGGAPLGLWVRGPVRLDELAQSVSIVGSREPTTYGTDVAADLAAHVAEQGAPVVSGAAFGIDYAAHRGALIGGGTTVAVLACGVDRVYPQAHAALLAHIAEEGAVVSELPPGTAPMRMRFLTRNRIIAALGRGTVVVEAAARSGALSTANWAERLNRPLMAVPGPVTSAPSEGAHHLIRTGAATLVTCGEQVMEQLGTVGEHVVADPRGKERSRDRLRAPDAQVLEAVPVAKPAPAESISRTAGISLVRVQGTLERLARDGFVVRTPRGEWVLGPAGLRD